MTDRESLFVSAEHLFDRARRRAFFEDVLGHLRGRPTDLLPFEEVKEKLGVRPSADRGLREIPLDQIVGSVGRYREFTRSFLPRDGLVRQRWKRIYAEAEGPTGLPPIEVYQIGDVYFIKDGNHRVSVARQMGAKTIQAYVTEFVSPVPIGVDTDIDDLILKAEKARFLRHTRLDDLRTEAAIDTTLPGAYDKIEEHIAVHGYFLGIDRQCEVCWEGAVTSWFDNVYLPLVTVIREHDILKDFPGRTETDLYLWIIEHRHYLAEELGQEIDLVQAAKHFAEQYSPRLERRVERAGQSLTEALLPEPLEPQPPAGQWREERIAPRGEDQFFADILLPLDGSPSAWCAVEQALTIAQREQGRFYGLYVARTPADQEWAKALQQEFVQHCQDWKVPCKFIVELGEPGEVISQRARWVDLVVLSEQGEHANWPQRLLGSTFQTVIRQVPRPVLVVVEVCAPLDRALLAYDGSPKSEEALFVAAHLAKKWKMPLAVVTVEERHRSGAETLQRAITLLQEGGLEAHGMLRRGRVSLEILKAARRWGSNLLIMGASGHSPFTDLFFRSTLDEVLRKTTCPVLICR